MAGIDIAGGGTSQFVSGDYLSAYSILGDSITTPLEVKYITVENTVLSNGITMSGGGLTDITFANPGIFNIQFSLQVTNNSPQAHLFYLWLSKNSNPVAVSASVLTIHSTHGGNKGHMIAAWNFFVQAAANDFFTLTWTADNVNIMIETIPQANPIPASPSVILTVQQI